LINQTFFHDGKSLTVDLPDQHYYAMSGAPPTIEEMLNFARDELDIIAPGSDLMYKNSFERFTQNVTSAFVVGKAVVKGVRCDHLAFRNAEVDWQIWIEEDQAVSGKFLVNSKRLRIAAIRRGVVDMGYRSQDHRCHFQIHATQGLTEDRLHSLGRLPCGEELARTTAMKNLKTLALGASLLAVLGAEIASDGSVNLGLIREAHAVIGVAPGGSVVRRRAVVGTAAVASSTANANAAATANANAAAANANAAAAAAAPAAAPAGPPAVGSIVTTLPPGCEPTALNGVDYQRCGGTYYRPSMQGSTLVFVVSQP
jgi:hypothetical protein